MAAKKVAGKRGAAKKPAKKTVKKTVKKVAKKAGKKPAKKAGAKKAGAKRVPRAPKTSIQYGQYTVPPPSEMVNFKVGQPAPNMLPLDKIRKAAAKKLAEKDPLYLQYGFIPGYPKFRESLAGFLTGQYGMEVDPDQLFINNGVTGGLSFALGLLASKGDLIFSEEPTYFLARMIFKDFGLKLEQIPMDEQGLDVDALERRLKSGGPIPKLLYTIPTAHNPTGRTMPTERREKLVDLAEKYGFTIMADEVYQLLTFPHVTPPKPMMHFDKGRGCVLAMSSFSKIMAPALRLGWFHAERSVLEPFFACGQMDSSGGFNPVTQGIIEKCITEGYQAKHGAWSRKTLWERADVLMKALDKSLPAECSYEVPQGGYFVLVKCPVGTDTVALNNLAMNEFKVQFLPGAGFGDNMKHYLRLSFSYYDAPGVQIGAERLGDCLRTFLADPEKYAPKAGGAKLW